jgi:hypothetical protein
MCFTRVLRLLHLQVQTPLFRFSNCRAAFAVESPTMDCVRMQLALTGIACRRAEFLDLVLAVAFHS